jgi:gliding motility-associated-like protein
MNKFFKYLLVVSLYFVFNVPTQVKAHAVQLGYCTSCDGKLRIWIEHWHNTENPNTTTMTLELNVNGNISNITGSPDTSVVNVPIGNLPGCFTPLNVYASCPNDANTYNDWVAFDFNGLPCGVPITVTILSGNTVFTQDGCNMYPASTGQIIIPCQTNQLPDVDTCAGNPLGPFNFPAGNTWTNDNPNIGLPATGTGNIPLFTTANNPTTQVGNITVNNNCGTSTFTITVFPAPVSNFDAIVGCPGQPITFNDLSTSQGGNITNWLWDFGDGSPQDNSQNPPPHVFPPGGPFNVTLTTTSANGCTHDTIIPVDPLSGLIANFVAPSVCDGSPMLFTDTSTPVGNITNWAWDFNNDGIVDDINQNPSFTFAGPGTYNVELFVVGTGGCTDSILIPVVVNPVPVTNFSSTNVCLGFTTTFNDLSNITSGSINTWQWDFGDGSGTSVLQNPTYTYTASGTYNVTLTVTSDSGCTNIFNANVQVYDNPITNFTPNTACAGANSLFTDISVLGSSGIQFWNWDFDNDGIVDDNNQNPIYVFPGGVGAYPVNLNIVDSNGCTHDTTITVNVSAQPTAAFTFTNECFGTATGFTDLSNSNGGTIASWDWDFQNDGIVDNTVQNPTNGYPAAGTYTTELLVTTLLGCVDSITMQVVVNPIPVANFSVADVCFGSVSSFSDLSNVATGNITNWQWDFGDGSGTSVLQNPSYTYANPGTYPVTLTITSDSGCIHTYIDSANVYFLPTAAFTTNNVCLNIAASFTDISNGNGGTINSWQWDFDNNGTIDDLSQNPTNFYSTDGTYNVQLIVSTASGCSDTVVQAIDIYPMPVADFTFVNACYGTSIAFTDNSSVINGTLSNWDWTFGNGNTSIVQNPSELYASEGVYSVQLIATTSDGCADTISKSIEVWPIPVVNFTPTDVCLNTPTQFNDLTNVSNTFTTNTIVQWSWTFGDGGTSNNQNPIYTYINDGVYQAQLTVISNNGCINDTILDVTVNPLPQVSFGADTLSGCSPVVVNFGDSTIINAPGILTSWYWDFGNGLTSSAQFPMGIQYENPSHSTVKTFGVSLTVTSDKGCVIKDSISNMISVYPIPLAHFTISPEITDIYDREITFTDESIFASVWSWNLGDGTYSTLANPIHEYPDSGNYLVTLFIENIYGCKDTTDKLVRINPTYAIYIPNVFTPDGDGINDFFYATGFGIKEIQMLIYDRWGTLIYEGYQLDSKWDGVYKGDLVQQDTYVYKIKVKDVFNVWHEYIGRASVLR